MRNNEALKMFEKDLEAAKKALNVARNPVNLSKLSPELRREVIQASKIADSPTDSGEKYIDSLRAKYSDIINKQNDAKSTR